MPAYLDDPDDGFDEGIETRLASRKEGEKPEDWVDLYRILFPEEEPVPMPSRMPILQTSDSLRLKDSRLRASLGAS